MAQGRPVANRVQPGKRPRSSMAPTLVVDKANGITWSSSVGSPGGALIIHYAAKTLYGVLHWGLMPQQATRPAQLRVAERTDCCSRTPASRPRPSRRCRRAAKSASTAADQWRAGHPAAQAHGGWLAGRRRPAPRRHGRGRVSERPRAAASGPAGCFARSAASCAATRSYSEITCAPSSSSVGADLQAQQHHDGGGERAVHHAHLRQRAEVPDQHVARHLPQQRRRDAAQQRMAPA